MLRCKSAIVSYMVWKLPYVRRGRDERTATVFHLKVETQSNFKINSLVTWINEWQISQLFCNCLSMEWSPVLLTLLCPCNKIQLNAPFILSLFHQSTSLCFGHICSPSSGGTYIYIYVHTHNIYIYVLCGCVYIYIYIYICSPSSGDIHIHTHYIYIYIYCVCVYIYMLCIYLYIYTHTIYIYIYIHIIHNIYMLCVCVYIYIYT